MEKVFINSAGKKGADIALVFSMSGYDVILYDTSGTKLINSIDRLYNILQYMVDSREITKKQKNSIMGRIEMSNTLNESKNCSLIIDVNNKETKREILKKIDSICPKETIILTDCPFESINNVSGSLYRADKVIGIRFFNPILTMGVIGWFKGIYTSIEVENKVFDIINSLGKTPIEMIEHSNNFHNVMLIPMINEAIEYLTGEEDSIAHVDMLNKMYPAYSMKPFALNRLMEDLENI